MVVADFKDKYGNDVPLNAVLRKAFIQQLRDTANNIDAFIPQVINLVSTGAKLLELPPGYHSNNDVGNLNSIIMHLREMADDLERIKITDPEGVTMYVAPRDLKPEE